MLSLNLPQTVPRVRARRPLAGTSPTGAAERQARPLVATDSGVPDGPAIAPHLAGLEDTHAEASKPVRSGAPGWVGSTPAPLRSKNACVDRFLSPSRRSPGWVLRSGGGPAKESGMRQLRR